MNPSNSAYVRPSVPPSMVTRESVEESVNVVEDATLAVPPEFGYDPTYWKEYIDLARLHDKELIGGLNAQLDSVLTFAGLFSGIITGFIVLSLGLLSKTPSDQTNALLRLLLLQQNVTTAEINEASEIWTLKPAGVRSSGLLSASLACALLTSMGAVLGKQWLAYYEKTGQVGTLDERGVKRQNKMDSLDIYSFRTFLFSLSFLIQIAVLLFLLGFIDYLYDLHHDVAAIVVILVGLGFIIYAYTVIAAAWDPECPFQTPISMALRTSSLYIKSIISSKFARDPPDGHRPPTGDTESAITEKSQNQSQILSPRSPIPPMTPMSPMDRVWMPFKHIVQPKSSAYDEELHKTMDSTMMYRIRSYATSVRWILETTSRQQALVEAARNIPALQGVEFTRRIFAKKDHGPLYQLSKRLMGDLMHHVTRLLHLTKKSGPDHVPTGPSHSQLLPNLERSAAYIRLVDLFRGALARYLTLHKAQPIPKGVVDEMIVYGRAVCHTLISSPNAKEGFERLSEQLSEFSSLAWLKDVDGELKLLLMCSLSHPRFWLYLENLDDSFDTVDISALPIYIAGISIASLAETASNRDLWVSQIARRSLSRGDPSPRVIGLAARSLVHIGNVDQNKMLRDFWNAYSTGTYYVSDVSAAFDVYFVNVETCPSSIEAYAALVKAFRTATQDLHNTPDSFYAQELRVQRQRQRHDLAKFGSNLLRALENILIEISDRIQVHTKEATGKIQFPVPSLPETHQAVSGSDNLLDFHAEILQSIKEGVLDHRWGFDLRLSGTALWRAAAVLEPDSITLPVVLELMRRTEEHQSHYIDLFQFYPSVASIITLSLKSEDSVIRQNALLLMRDKAPTWFKEPEIDQYFADAELDRSLASHVRLGNTMHNRVVSLVGAVGSTLQWKKKFLDAFHEVVLSTDLNSTSSDSLEMLQLSLDVWYELGKTQIVPGVSLAAANRNWHSDQMLSIITEYVLHRVQFYKTRNSMERMQLANVGTSASLQEYVDQVELSEKLSQSAAGQKLLQAFKIWTELLSYNT